MNFTPVTTRTDAERAFSELRKTLRAHARALRSHVGWPHGHGIYTVYWHASQLFWALPRNTPDIPADRFWCAFGTQNPLQHKENLNITCEINPSKSGKDRRCAGVFLRDSGGALYVGHNGRIGGGRKGVGKNAFLDSYRKDNASGTQTVQWPDGKAMPLVIIGKVSSPTFLSDLGEFIFTVEGFKDKAVGGDVGEQLDQDAEKAERQGEFEPRNKKEWMEKTLREVNLRRGQPAFRKTLLKAYGGRCAISGCDCEDALEAAHIRPYSGQSTNHVQNGLLLRGDLHTLFDIGKIGIDPDTRRVVVARSLVPTVYGRLGGKRLRSPSWVSQLANPRVLREHLERWRLKS